MDKLLLRPNEAAEVLGIGRTRTYELLARGDLPGVVRIGKSVRISAESLRDWVRQQAASQPSGARNS